MKIAIVDPVGNHGGGSRFIRSLLPAIARVRPDFDLTFYGSSVAIHREGFREEFEPAGIKVKTLCASRLSQSSFIRNPLIKKGIRIAQERWLMNNKWLPTWLTGNVASELEDRIRGYDLVFFPWPFLMKFPRLNCPLVGVFHDFNYRYYFSGEFTFSPYQRAILERKSRFGWRTPHRWFPPGLWLQNSSGFTLFKRQGSGDSSSRTWGRWPHE